MASHRKPRTRILKSASTKRGVIGVTTAALASVSLLSQSAQAAPDDGKPSVSEVKKKVDKLYQQAEVSTQKYNEAEEKTDAQRKKADRSLDEAAERTAKLNDARRELGNYATAQYRTGGMSETATLLLTEDPQQFFQQSHMLDRMSGRQKEAVADFEKQQKAAQAKRESATEELASLEASQKALKKNKREVQDKLSEARQLLSKLTAEEKARLAAIEKKKQEEARKAAERAEEARDEAGKGGGSQTAQAQKVLAYAKKQLGKPYVWGATGPSSFDCSGLTQGAWKAAGISLPRTTWDQVKIGTKVAKSEMKTGDLIFFFDDISHVGIYVGNGQMIHAPKPGAEVRYESTGNMPFHSAVRPG
ncbi:glycoside hydrolase [Streptomyces abyssalis]|uniref:Glycoside hydrolase n=1 Tax=Streptomyces abyssalis TaxID=933944 RepID=A0A1E7JFR2_9ACTN|nr:NlpC/P60 family protein [Streptomyces abyssalis]OEU85313.1 glycoside hydrolase [Streptomyces abyssalis]OEU91518.1 glycoside hydrolase [Streptomyces abyssalis]OEV05271.1 glycoside hydrolase [Streptomyces nanshensis]